MYDRVQKSSSSWNPSPTQKKKSSKYGPRTFTVQPRRETKSFQTPVPRYSPDATNKRFVTLVGSIEAPVQRQADTETLQSSSEQVAAPVSEAVEVSQQSQIQQRIQKKEDLVQLTPTSSAIKPLISYSAFDWEVTDADEKKILELFRKDPNLSATITDLNSDGMLDDLLTRVDENGNRHDLIQMLGSKLDVKTKALVEPHIKSLGQEWELQFNLARLGVTAASPAFDATPFKSLISNDPTHPFTGVGATGVNPTTLSIGLVDKGLLAAHHANTTAKYTNPIPGSLPAYLATLTPVERVHQAELLLRQQISSVMANSYANKIPSRAQVIRAAAKAHNLHPELIAAFILAEQRDQSKNEDAKDYIGAQSFLQGNTSIGLGQVVISTAQNNDLFADLLSNKTRKDLDHDKIAERLASDEFNIFAAARYIRQVANEGSKIPVAKLPKTKARFPRIDMAAYAGNSSTWPDDNIRVLGMYYTSKAWTDNIGSQAWGDFVFEAYQDVKASGVF